MPASAPVPEEKPRMRSGTELLADAHKALVRDRATYSLAIEIANYLDVALPAWRSK